MTENISYIILSGGIILCRFHWMMQEREDTDLIASFLARQPTERCAGHIKLLFYTMNHITHIQMPLWNTLDGAARSPPQLPCDQAPFGRVRKGLVQEQSGRRGEGRLVGMEVAYHSCLPTHPFFLIPFLLPPFL